MNLMARQKTENTTQVHQPPLKRESLPELLYLLDKSLKRYGYLQEHGAPDTLLDAEKNLFCSRLLTLRMELKK